MNYYSQFLIADIPVIFLVAGLAFALGVLFRDLLPKKPDDQG